MNFDYVQVSTQTFIVRSNIAKVDLETCFASIDAKPSITLIKYKQFSKGEEVVKKQHSTAGGKNFLNCVTLSIVADKKINVKIFNNGVFQLTGCKKLQHAVYAMNIILLEFYNKPWVTTTIEQNDASHTNHEHHFVFYVISAMRNIDFEIGFKIDRKKLGTLVGETTSYPVPPITTGYMGVKIKIPILDVSDVTIPKYSHDGKCTSVETATTYGEYFKSIYPNHKKLLKKYFVSVSVFQNGKVLMSGLDKSIQKSCYEWFINLVRTEKNTIGILDTNRKTFRR